MNTSVIWFTSPDLVAFSVQGLRSQFGRLELSVTRQGRPRQAHGHLAVRAARHGPDVIANSLGKGSHSFPVIPVQVGTVPAAHRGSGRATAPQAGQHKPRLAPAACQSRVRTSRSCGPPSRRRSIRQVSTNRTSGTIPDDKRPTRSLSCIVASPTRQAHAAKRARPAVFCMRLLRSDNNAR